MAKENKYDEYNNASDHDLLIKLVVMVDMLSEGFEEHKKKHWSITMAIIGAFSAGLTGLTTSLILLFVKLGYNIS